jgi:amino acid transporter
MVFATMILIAFGILNILGVKKAGIIQTVLSGLLVTSVFFLAVAALFSPKSNGINMEPIWGFDKAAAMAANASGDAINEFAHSGTGGIISAILATFAIAPWAFVGFDTIPQAAEEFNFSYKKVIGIMVIAIVFGCFVYTTNNTVAAAVLENWPERVMAGEWVLLVAAEEMLGLFGKVLIGVAVSSAVLSGIMGFYLASSRLLYSMAKGGYLPMCFGIIDPKYGTPKNAIVFCIIISLTGPILGREALGWFVDMSAIGASMGFFFTSASALKKMREDRDGTAGMKVLALCGTVFSLLFMFLQLVPIPGLNGVHFGTESYLMLAVWVILGVFFYITQINAKKDSDSTD